MVGAQSGAPATILGASSCRKLERRRTATDHVLHLELYHMPAAGMDVQKLAHGVLPLRTRHSEVADVRLASAVAGGTEICMRLAYAVCGRGVPDGLLPAGSPSRDPNPAVSSLRRAHA